MYIYIQKLTSMCHKTGVSTHGLLKRRDQIMPGRAATLIYTRCVSETHTSVLDTRTRVLDTHTRPTHACVGHLHAGSTHPTPNTRPASLDPLTNHPQVDMLRLRYKPVNFRARKGSGPPKRCVQIDSEGLVFEAHILLYHSTRSSRVIKKKRRID